MDRRVLSRSLISSPKIGKERMLHVKDAREETDRRVARGVARWNGTNDHGELALPLLPYTRDLELANQLRTLMETDGHRTGSLRPVTVEGQPAFIYVCLSDQQRPFAQGVGPTPALAICDAFLLCCPDEP